MENLRPRNLLFRNKGKFGVLLGAILFFTFAIVPLWNTPSRLPDINSLMSKTLLDRNQRPIQVPLNEREERATLIQLDEIPLWLQESFTQAEDRRFHSHFGIDLLAIVRAGFQSVQQGRNVSGASTITMQLVRIYWPELAKPKNKLAQMIQAMLIEARQSKSDILVHYFNTVPFSRQVVGLKQACYYFFNKSCNSLSLAEGASLAVIPRNPNFYIGHAEALLKARNRVAEKVAEKLRIEKLVLQQALEEPIHLRFADTKSGAFHFAQRISQESNLQQSGEVQTTLDIFLQQTIQDLLHEQIAKNPKLGNAGAVLVVENRTGNVLAYIGSPGYFVKGHGMLDAIQARRSPGSALKPFVYAYALQQGWTLSSVIPDVPITFKVEKGIFSPKNYGGSFSGPQQIRYALANSKNIPALFLTAKLGEASVLEFLRKVGFKSLTLSPDHYGVGVSLGNGEVSLWELVQAYSSLARGGIFQPLRLVEESTETPIRTMPEEIAFLISDVLSDPLARAEEFGRDGVLEFDFKVSAKTGTSNNYRDHWTVGYSSQYTVGVWKGNADGSPLEAKIPAARGAGFLFKQVMLKLHENSSPKGLGHSDEIVQTRVCSLSGHLAGKNCTETRLEYFQKNHLPHHQCETHRKKTVQNCKGHTKEVNYISLPEEYRSWAKANYLPVLENVLKEECGWSSSRIQSLSRQYELKIVEPVSGTILAVDPTIPMSHQKLRVQFAHPIAGKNTKLLLNGKLYQNLSGNTYIDWPIEKGNYSFQLQRGNEFSEEVAIRVF